MTNSAHEYENDPRNADVLISVNGELVARDKAVVSVFDSGFVLGDGVWEGLRLHNGKLAFIDKHMERLWEGAKALDMDPDDYDTLRDEALIRKVVSTNLPVGPDSTTTIEDQVANGEPGLEDLWVEYEVKHEVVDAIRLLPRKERMAVNLYYIKGLTLKEIGRTLGVTESRACQLRSQGVKRLKIKLKIDP